VFKQFSGHAPSQDSEVFADVADLKRHQQLEKLYISTRAAKVCQDIFTD
jgi:hypothetical protein